MKRSEQYQEIRTLTDAVIDKQATDAEVNRLKQLLASDKNAQDFYFDYVGVHTRLKDSAAQNIEFVYRRLTEEEFIMRPAGHSEQKMDNKQGRILPADNISDVEPPFIESPFIEPPIKGSPSKPISISTLMKWLTAILLFFGILWAFISWFTHDSASQHFRALLFSGVVTTGEFGQINGNELLAGEYHIKQKSSIGFLTGETINLAEDSVITLFSNDKVELKQGAISIISVPNNSIELRTAHITLHSNGDSLSVDLRNSQTTIKSGKQTLFSPDRWRPKHYWSFDGKSDRAIDFVGNADGVVYSGASRVRGLVGDGAFLFDNSDDTRLNLGSGGGSALGTGSFSVTDGVTIEALVKPLYSGRKWESDHIFRKGQTDGQFRILLSFQNDEGKNYLRPEGQFKQSLSFGLFILGHGYHELKLPLDGLSGRPTLSEIKDGKYHHVVASYNAVTGVKAIYIDGKKMAFYQYPPGSKMLSGGSGQANIGNSPTYPQDQHHGKQGYNIETSGEISIEPLTRGVVDRHGAAFNGVIDEVAFYDFALPDFMVQNHYEQIQQGYNYFGLTPNAKRLPQKIKLPLPALAIIQLEPSTGLPNHITSQK
ncbi:LamG domain-containing protein [Paraglaciecola aquimarina]|uniref:LamG domain-containing protein n=1 Tax=Paraglaciecola algarum TaxID=3050085 RepID=A0ABS9D828_9ALTE|nr:LamG domain-containing protein [Paraglaciecola sp. G1-23]MCF2948859.1 LamG domain-containing protein [Paraglaciecola sp. G1-23]